MHRRSAILAAAVGGAFAFPAVAEAHVSIHPNVVPAGANATITLSVPNETDNTATTGIAVQMPPGFLDVSAAPPPGWKFSTKTKKLGKPVQGDNGPITSEVSEIDLTGGKLPPGQFLELPLAVAMPGKAGDVLTFKTVQTYSDGKVVRWIGTPDSPQPAPTIDVSAKGGVVEDVAGGEAGPPASAGQAANSGPTSAQSSTPTATTMVQKRSSNGLAIAALVVAVIAALLAAASLAVRRRAVSR
ncbi:MAG: hypothetical protein QOK21_4037 [Solirubrobacteraceae bacterium]|jgi:uncharacterized protein YcnI|nr:hypothetical protein [Solirubrobacteraceae bacterium]